MSKAYHRPFTPQRSLWDSLPSRAFVRLDAMRSFDLQHLTVLYKTRPAVSGMTVDAAALVELPFGSVETLTCGGIAVGYELTMPKCRVEVGQNFVTFSLRDRPDTASVTKYVENKDIAVMGNSQALLVVSDRRYWTGEAQP